MDFIKKTEKIFEDANFIKNLGIKILEIKKGYCETQLEIRDFHRQQHGFIHAGVIATLADHTAGAAATTIVHKEEEVLTIEFKINFLRPAEGEFLICRSGLIREGRRIMVAESDVFSIKSGAEKAVAKAIVTLMGAKI